MQITFWYQLVGAVIAGNVLTAMLAFFWFSVNRNEKQGRDPYDVPFTTWLCGVIPPLIILGGLIVTVA